MSVAFVNLQVGAVSAIAKQCVGKNHGAIMTAYIPLVRIRTIYSKRLAFAIESFYLIYIFGELMNGLSSRRRAAHAYFQYLIFQIFKSRFYGCFMMNRIPEGDLVFIESLCLSMKGHDEQKKKQFLHGLILVAVKITGFSLINDLSVGINNLMKDYPQSI